MECVCRDKAVSVWSFSEYCAGGLYCSPSRDMTGGIYFPCVTSACISRGAACGVVGDEAGRLSKFGLQSGMFRGVFCESACSYGEVAVSLLERSMYSCRRLSCGFGVLGVVQGDFDFSVASVGCYSFIFIWDFHRLFLRYSRSVPADIELVIRSEVGVMTVGGAIRSSFTLWDLCLPGGRWNYGGGWNRVVCLSLLGLGCVMVAGDVSFKVRVVGLLSSRHYQVVELGSLSVSVSLCLGGRLFNLCDLGCFRTQRWREMPLKLFLFDVCEVLAKRCTPLLFCFQRLWGIRCAERLTRSGGFQGSALNCSRLDLELCMDLCSRRACGGSKGNSKGHVSLAVPFLFSSLSFSNDLVSNVLRRRITTLTKGFLGEAYCARKMYVDDDIVRCLKRIYGARMIHTELCRRR